LVHWSKSKQSFVVAKVFYVWFGTESMFTSIEITVNSHELLYAS
jgi:hypothetical protein